MNAIETQMGPHSVAIATVYDGYVNKKHNTTMSDASQAIISAHENVTHAVEATAYVLETYMNDFESARILTLIIDGKRKQWMAEGTECPHKGHFRVYQIPDSVQFESYREVQDNEIDAYYWCLRVTDEELDSIVMITENDGEEKSNGTNTGESDN